MVLLSAPYAYSFFLITLNCNFQFTCPLSIFVCELLKGWGYSSHWNSDNWQSAWHKENKHLMNGGGDLLKRGTKKHCVLYFIRDGRYTGVFVKTLKCT